MSDPNALVPVDLTTGEVLSPEEAGRRFVTAHPEVAAPLAVRVPITPDQETLIRRTIAKDATPEELQLFFYDCRRRGVHPLDKLIHFTKRGGKYTPVTSIDFMRSRAGDTGESAGSDDAVFVGDVKKPDFAATVTVYRLVQGQRCPFTATARWSEYKPESNDFMWQRMPHTMLGKCAEALALRKAFPQQLAGLYTTDEMEQAGPTEPAVSVGVMREPFQSTGVVTQQGGAGRSGPVTGFPVSVQEQPFEDVPLPVDENGLLLADRRYPETPSPTVAKAETGLMVLGITSKEGTNARGKWKKFSIRLNDGRTVNTFDAKIADAAKVAMDGDRAVYVEATKGTYGWDVEELKLTNEVF